MNANDTHGHPWIRKESKLLKDSVEAFLPTVGICLGAQMMAKALGGSVERNEQIELGWFSVSLNREGMSDPVLSVAGKSPTVYQWHEDTFHLPPGATLLASSRACPRQAYRVHESAYGFQFHPEADRQLIQGWLEVEGVANEILKIRKSCASKTVQTALIQRKNAIQVEKFSMKIATAIGALFRREKSPKIYLRKLKNVCKPSENIRVCFLDSQNKSAWLKGKVIEQFQALGEDYILLQEAHGTVWPVCLSDVSEFSVL